MSIVAKEAAKQKLLSVITDPVFAKCNVLLEACSSELIKLERKKKR